jgi:hypothetical protein
MRQAEGQRGQIDRQQLVTGSAAQRASAIFVAEAVLAFSGYSVL